ncbi:cupin domain-containing protein [Pelagibius sp.]|uniref:cupin domain-containing protein n=1 Tax=Pelagibius sp. TaxID=1931238 RepID=UPI003BAEAE69
MTSKANLLRDLPPAASEEIFETLLQRPGVKLERIISSGQTTPEGECYDQEEDEWVLLLAGAAKLAVEGGAGTMEEHDLAPGDALLLPAHCRHRVTWTDPLRPTIWLALHVSAAQG